MKKQKSKLQKVVYFNPLLARALLLTKAKTVVSYTIDVVRFNAKTKELIATNGKTLIIVTVKSAGELLPFNLETGFYDIRGDVLIKSDRAADSRFPPYESIIPTGEKICSGDILSGIVDCMIKQQVYLDIWKYENTLKVLNKFSVYWDFTNDSPALPVMMEANSDKFNVKYIIMPISK